MAEMPGWPSRATPSASKNSTLRPPRPWPRTVTVVSPPESRRQGGANGWPYLATWRAVRRARRAVLGAVGGDARHDLADVPRLALDGVAQDEARHARLPRHRRR